MYFNFSSCLLQYLLSNGSVSLLGLGTFYIRESSKDFSLTKNVLSPPIQKLVFEDHSREDIGFVQFVSSKLGYTIEQSKTFIKDSVDKINVDLVEKSMVSIPGIGKLKVDESEKSFTPIAENFHPDFLYMPSLPLTPLAKKKEKKNVKKEPQNSEFEKLGKVSAIDKHVVAANHNKSSDVQDKMSIMEDHNSSSNQSSNTTNNPPSNSYYYEDDKSFFQEIRGPLFWLLLLGLAVFLFSRYGCSKLTDKASDAISGTVEKAGEVVDDVTNVDVDSSTGLLTPEGEAYTGKYSDVLTQEIIDDGCVIVVGSFKKSKNALRMRNKIIEKGYQPFDEYHNGFNRVGIIFDCLDQDLVDFIQEIRRNIEPKAWYRIPGYEVAYE